MEHETEEEYEKYLKIEKEVNERVMEALKKSKEAIETSQLEIEKIVEMMGVNAAQIE